MRTEPLFIPRIKMEKRETDRRWGPGTGEAQKYLFPGMCCLAFPSCELSLGLLDPAHILQDIFFVFGLLGERIHSVNLLMTYHA